MNTDILYQAIQKVNELTTLKCEIVAPVMKRPQKQLDAEIEIKNNGDVIRYFAEIKKRIVPADVFTIKEKLKNIGNLILIAEYITGKAKELLQINNIPYIDTVGNMFLKTNRIHIHIETNKTNRESIKKGNRAFTKTGLKVVYQFLIHPDSLNKPYRYIADNAKVTIDTVRQVILELLKEGFIVKLNDKKYRFAKRNQLFNEWVSGYNRTLKPNLKQNRYRFLNKDIRFTHVDLPKDAYWGGAVAAEIMTDYLIADTGIIYTDMPLNDLMKLLKLIPDKTGNITLIETFWKAGQEKEKLADFILVYADLIESGDPRYIETAEKIFIKYVQDYL